MTNIGGTQWGFGPIEFVKSRITSCLSGIHKHCITFTHSEYDTCVMTDVRIGYKSVELIITILAKTKDNISVIYQQVSMSDERVPFLIEAPGPVKTLVLE